MARLSGLASEHHPEGPGDAPRRKMARKSKAPSVDLTSGTKRPASPDVVVSTKRARRVAADDHDQLNRELDESVSRSQQASDTIKVAHSDTRHHRRRHSEPLAAYDEHQGEVAAKTPPPATQPLPPLSRVGKASRRARMSMPAQLHMANVDETDGMKEVQFAPLRAVLDGRAKRRLRRSHLSEEVNDIEDHKKQDEKIRKAYAELRRQLRDKETVIQDLEYQLEANRMGNIDISDVQTEQLQQQLEDARKQIEELRASSVYDPASRETSAFLANDDDDDDGDGNGLMLVDPVELNLSRPQSAEPLPIGTYASRVLESSQITIESLSSLEVTARDMLAEASQADHSIIPDRIADIAVKRYESEIEHLRRQVADTHTALRLVTVEFQNLNILSPGAHINDILTTLRHVLEDAREKYEKIFPDSLADLTNERFLTQVMDDLEGLHAELLEKVIIAEKQNQRITLLQNQYENVVDHLADSEARNDELTQEVKEIQTNNAAAEEAIVKLEVRLNDMRDVSEKQDTTIKENDVLIHGLRDELEDKETTLDRLRQALEGYRKDVETLTDSITSLERQHADTISILEEEHATTVQDLQDHLKAETDDRAIAEGDAQQKAEYIDELEGRIVDLDAQFDEYQAKVTQLQQRLTEETQARETAEAERDGQADIVYSHANTIENLNEMVEDLGKEIQDFHANLDSERNQRQQTEADLDEANEKISDLNSQIHNMGIQANELRSKLFQIQQEREQAIAGLSEDARLRDEEHEKHLGAETKRRQDAEQQVIRLEAQNAGLEDDLSHTQEALTEMSQARAILEADRDSQITKLNRQLDDLKKKYTALDSSTRSTIESLQATITDLTNEVQSLRANVEQLEATAAETADQHTGELADRDATINGLQDDLEAARSENANLAKENKSLANRVENEANELLNIMGAHAQEANALRQVIATQEAHIEDLETSATQRAAQHAEAIAALTQEIEERRIIGEARTEHIVALEAQLEDIKGRFRIQAEDSQNTIDELLNTNRQALAKQEELADKTKRRTADTLKAVAEMKVDGLEVKTKGINLKKIVDGKVTKHTERLKVSKRKGSRKSYRDSAIGTEIADDGVELEQARLDEAVLG